MGAQTIAILHTAIARNADTIARNAEGIAGIGGRMPVIESVLTAILGAVLPNPNRAIINSPAAIASILALSPNPNLAAIIANLHRLVACIVHSHYH